MPTNKELQAKTSPDAVKLPAVEIKTNNGAIIISTNHIPPQTMTWAKDAHKLDRKYSKSTRKLL